MSTEQDKAVENLEAQVQELKVEEPVEEGTKPKEQQKVYVL
jgi:hypothetical protein